MKNPGIYILTNTVTGMQYAGKDRHLPNRATMHLNGKTPGCRHIHRAIKKYGRDAFSVEIIRYPGISQEALNAVERWKIRQLQTLAPSGYNLTEGGEGGIPSEETRQKHRANIHKQIADGTHHFLDSEFQRRTNKKRLEEGTHNFLGDNNPSHKRVANGTHNLLGESNPMKRLSKEGRHPLLGEKNPSHKRVEAGTHNFLGESNPNHKRVADGTHHFLGEKNPIKKLAKEGRHPSTHKRLKAEWCYIIAVSRFWYEIHDYTLKRRAEFLSKDIPDTSNAEQEYLF